MSVLDVVRDGAVTHLALNRPDEGNALDLEMLAALEDATAQARSDGTRVIALTARGPLFCGGGDVAAISAHDDPVDVTLRLAESLHRALLHLAEAPLALVVGAQGPAAGAGLALLLNADHVVAADNATLVTAYSALGVSSDGGTTYLLPRIVGRTRASELALSGRRLDAGTARDWGIVSEIVPAPDVAQATATAARRLADARGEAIAQTKRLLNASWLPGYREHLADEARTIARLMGTEPAQARRQAFLARRR